MTKFTESLHEIVNTDSYPIHDLENQVRRELLATVHSELEN